MNVIYTVLLAFTFGYFIKNRGIAICIYLAFGAILFTFQSANLVLDWAGGGTEAFGGPFPDYSGSSFLSYGIINLIIFCIGIGLVVLGGRMASRRSRRADLVEVG